MLRPTLGILIGFLVVTLVPSYGGIGVNLLLAVVRGEVPRQSVYVYLAIAGYAVVVTSLLVALGLLTLAEFANWKLRERGQLIQTVWWLLFLLALVHLFAISTKGTLGDSEAKNLFIDGSLFEAVLTMTAVGLFVGLGRVGNNPGRATDKN